MSGVCCYDVTRQTSEEAGIARIRRPNPFVIGENSTSKTVVLEYVKDRGLICFSV